MKAYYIKQHTQNNLKSSEKCVGAFTWPESLVEASKLGVAAFLSLVRFFLLFSWIFFFFFWLFDVSSYLL